MTKPELTDDLAHAREMAAIWTQHVADLMQENEGRAREAEALARQREQEKERALDLQRRKYGHNHTMAQVIALLLEEHGCSQRALAERLDVTPSWISRLMHDTTRHASDALLEAMGVERVSVYRFIRK